MSSQASSIDEKDCDDIQLSPTETSEQNNKHKKAVGKNKPKQTLLVTQQKDGQILAKSKAIKKPIKQSDLTFKKRTPDDQLKSIQNQSKLSAFQKNPGQKSKPVKIKSPLKPSIKFCDVTYEQLLKSSNGEKQEIFKYQGNRQALKLCCPNRDQSSIFVSDKACLICKHESGLKTKTKAGEIHLICGLLCDLVSVDFETMEFSLDTWSEPDGEEKCEICDRKGFLLKCLKKQCKKFVHAFCIQEQRKRSLIQQAQQDITMKDDQESSEEEQTLQGGWLLQFKLDNYTNERYTAAPDLLKPMSATIKTDLQLYTAKNTPMKHKITVKNVMEICLPSRVYFPQRGGKIDLFCEDHRIEEPSCWCNNKIQSFSMVMCDHCNLWYHTKCEGYKIAESSPIQEYQCSQCKEWETKTEDVINKVILQQSEHSVFKDQQEFCMWPTWQRSLLPRNRQMPHKLSSILKIAQAWSIQSKQLETVPCSLEMLQQQILVAQHIPLKLKIDILNQRIQKAVDQQAVNPLPTIQLKQIVDIEGNFDLKAIDYNSKQAEAAQTAIQQQFQQIGVYTIDAIELQRSIIDQNKLQKEAHSVLTGASKINVQQLRELCESIDQQELTEKVVEVLKIVEKWVKTFESKKITTLEEAESHLSAQPKQVILENEITLIQQEITKSKKWDEEYVKLEDLEKIHFITQIHEIKYKSPKQLQILAELKPIGFEYQKLMTTIDRQTRCQKNLEDVLKKLSSDTETIQLMKRYFQGLRDTVKNIESQIFEMNEGQTEVSQEKIENLNSLIAKIPFLVPGEVEFNKIQKLVDFAAGTAKTIHVEYLKTKVILSDKSIQELRDQAINLDQQINANIQQFYGSEKLEDLNSLLATITQQQKELSKLHVEFESLDLKQIVKFVDQYEKFDLPNAKREQILQLETQLISVKKIAPKMNVLERFQRDIQTQMSKIAAVSLMSGKFSYKKLMKLKEDQDKLDKQSLQQLNDTIKIVDAFLVKVQQQIEITDPGLRKKLAAGEQNKLIEMTEALAKEAAEIRLDLTETQSKQLLKVKKWAQIVCDCHNIKQLTQDKLETLHSGLRNLKSLAQDIPQCNAALNELRLLESLQKDIREILKSSSTQMLGKIKTKLNEIIPQFKLIDTAKVECIINYQEQLKESERWVEMANKQDSDTDALLKELDEDDGSLKFVPLDTVKQLKLKAFKLLFVVDEQSVRPTPKDFIAKIDKSFSRADLELEEMKSEMQIFQIAKNARTFADGRSAAKFSLNDTTLLIQHKLPFSLSKQSIDQLKKAVEEMKKLKSKIDSLKDQQAPIADFMQHQESLKGLAYRTELEDELKQLKQDHDFIQQLAKQIEEINNNKEENEILISFKELRQAEKLHDTLKCQSNSLACLEFLQTELKKFENVAVEIKTEQNWSYQRLYEVEMKLGEVLVDFEKRDTEIKRKIWDLRLLKFIDELNDKMNDQLEVIQADVPRYWLEDAQFLELTKDPKYDTLNDLVEKVDMIYKAYHQCTNDVCVETLNTFVQEICPRLTFERIVTETKQKLANKQGEDFKVVEYLQKLLNGARDNDSDEHMTDVQESSDEEMSQCEEEASDTEQKQNNKKSSGTKRLVKAEEKKDKSLQKATGSSSKKLEEMKARIAKTALKKPIQPKSTTEAVKAKPMLKTKKVVVEKKEEPESKPVVKGLAGGVKIGGGLKSKLTSLKKPAQSPLKPAESKEADIQQEKEDGEKPAVEKEKEDEPVAKPKVAAPSLKLQKPAITKVDKPESKVAKKEEPKVEKAESKLTKKDEPKKKTGVVTAKPAEEEAKSTKPQLKKPQPKKVQEEAETATESPKEEKPSLKPKPNALAASTKVAPPQISGIKRKAVGGGGGGLAASLNRMK